MKKEDVTIVLLTGLGVNHRFMIPYQLYLRANGWKCEIVKNSLFATNNVLQYSNDLKDILNNCNKAYLIGFSLGGVASAYTLASSDYYLDKVEKAYTVCSPVLCPADWLYDNTMFRVLCNHIPVPDIMLPRFLCTLRKLGREFQHHVIDSQIMRSAKTKRKLHSFFHKNDKISPPEKSYFVGTKSQEIRYDYPWLPKMFHHHIACGDPRIFLDILKEIKKDIRI